MAGRPNVLRPVKLTTNLPEDVFARLTLYLWSPSENRVPKGAYSKFLINAINNALPKDPPDAATSNS